MPTLLTDLDEYFSPGLVLTVLGKRYTVPLPCAELGLWCQRIAQAGGAIQAADSPAEVQAAVDRVNKLPELDGDLSLAQRVLGSVYDELVADKVPHPYVEYCGATAFAWIVAGEDAAARYWASGGRPEAGSPANRKERRAATQKTSTGGVSETSSRASTSGTSSRTRSAKRGAGRRSRGSNS